MSAWREYGRKIARSSIVAVLLVALLGGVSYYLFPQYSSPIGPTPSLVYAWVEGNESQTGEVYENMTVLWQSLDFEFIFVNGSSIHEPNVGGHEIGEEWVIRPEYHGEFDATDLLKIVIRRFSVLIMGVKDFTLGQEHIETFTHGDNTTSFLEAHGNFSISVSLRSIDVIDLGTLKLIDWGYYSDSGYWKNGAWTIDVNQLSSMLPGSGTALVTFDAILNVYVQYEIPVEGTTKTGENDLSWEGSMGTLEIVYDQDKLMHIRYDFESIRLILLKVP